MARKRHTPEQIIAKVREIEVDLAKGKKTGQACRAAGISEHTYYKWKKQYGGMRIDQAKRLKELEQENARLKKLQGFHATQTELRPGSDIWGLTNRLTRAAADDHDRDSSRGAGPVGLADEDF